jgi:hypothetical protein
MPPLIIDLEFWNSILKPSDTCPKPNEQLMLLVRRLIQVDSMCLITAKSWNAIYADGLRAVELEENSRLIIERGTFLENTVPNLFTVISVT